MIKVESRGRTTTPINVPYPAIPLIRLNRLCLVLMAILSACATPPTLKKPATRTPFVAADPAPQLTALPASTVQRLDTKLNLQFDWWRLLQSSTLNTLIEQTFIAHRTLADAQATLLKVQQSHALQLGYFYSAVTVNNTANNLTLSLTTSTPLSDEKFIGAAYYDLPLPAFTVGYVPELLRVHEAGTSKAQAEITQLQLEATYRTLAVHLIAALLQESSLRAQMTTLRKVLAIHQSQLQIARRQQQAGLIKPEAVATQQALTTRTESALSSLKIQFEHTRELLRLLLAVPLTTPLPELLNLTELSLREALPLELPAYLMAHRPDLRAAQSAMLPLHTEYQHTANLALQQVEHTLLAIHQDGIALKAALAVQHENALALSALLVPRLGPPLNYAETLMAEQNALLAALQLSQARTHEFADALALYHSLGGAWWNDDQTVNLEMASELSPHNTHR